MRGAEYPRGGNVRGDCQDNLSLVCLVSQGLFEEPCSLPLTVAEKDKAVVGISSYQMAVGQVEASYRAGREIPPPPLLYGEMPCCRVDAIIMF